MASGSRIRDWSTIPANNELVVPFGAPTNWFPSEVSPWSRQSMATIRTQMENAEWFNWGHTATQISGTIFFVPTDLTAGPYVIGARLRIADTTTLYATIINSQYVAPNTIVTVAVDSGALSAAMNGQNVEVGIIGPNNTSLPITALNPLYYGASSGTNTYTATLASPKITSYEIGRIYNIAIGSTNTGASTMNINGIGLRPVTLFGAIPLSFGNFAAGMTAQLFYDGTRFLLMNPSKASFYVQAFVNTNQNINDGVTADVIFDSVLEDTSGFYNPSNGRFTPTFPCRVFAKSNVNFNVPTGVTGDGIQVIVGKNGNNVWAGDITNQAGATRLSVQTSGMVTLNGAGDYLTIRLFNNTQKNGNTINEAPLSHINIFSM